MAIYFYKEFGEYGYLASYSLHGFNRCGIYWKTVEHYYQAHKFQDENVKKLIINATTPKIASEIGRSRQYAIKENWDEIKDKYMFEAVLSKFASHSDIRGKLLDTGNEEIIEETTKESYWGCGSNKDGKNTYGKILCKVRELLREEPRCCGEEGIYEKILCEQEGL